MEKRDANQNHFKEILFEKNVGILADLILGEKKRPQKKRRKDEGEIIVITSE
jgi:hypothetical protein